MLATATATPAARFAARKAELAAAKQRAWDNGWTIREIQGAFGIGSGDLAEDAEGNTWFVVGPVANSSRVLCQPFRQAGVPAVEIERADLVVVG